ncbi:MAG: NAD-dependent epimerase [Nitrospirota bacterium]
MNMLVTGAAGFIGSHLSTRLLAEGHRVVGLDNLNDYYDVQLKLDRVSRLKDNTRFGFVQLDIANKEGVAALFSSSSFDRVYHLAAQAGVRYSLTNPHVYIESNLLGFLNILEGCRHHTISHLIYASSSSVYGGNTKMPFATHDPADHPLSLYGATKKANELMAHSYSHLYNIPTTGLRFFTVYGPWGRPDMALFLFAKAIVEQKPIDVFNFGEMERDFTYIDDIVEGIVRVGENIPTRAISPVDRVLDPSQSFAPYRVFNIGNHNPISILALLDLLEKEMGKKTERRMLPMQPGDVPKTFANVDDLALVTGFVPKISIEEGVRRFVAWYKAYYGHV